MSSEPDDSQGSQQELEVRPLGFLAIGFAALSALLALSVFLSALAYIPAAIAIPLGFVSRGDEPTRRLGNASLVIAFGAVIWATFTVLFVLLDDSFGY